MIRIEVGLFQSEGSINGAGAKIGLVPEAITYLDLFGEAGNWQGLICLSNDRFLMATDKFPKTIFALVEMRKRSGTS